MNDVANPTLTVEAVLKDTTAHGFVFFLDKVRKHNVPFSNVPILRIVDSKQFDVSFPGVQLKASNGTSPKVSSQRIGRDFAYENQAMPEAKRNEQIKRQNVEWLLGIKASTTRTVEVVKFGGPLNEDGTRTLYDTAEEADSAWLAWQMAQ